MLLRRSEGYQFHRFCRKGGFAVLPSEHPLAARDSISFSELEKQVIIRMGNAYVPFNTGNPLTRLVQLHELSNRDIYCDDDRMMMSLAKAGYGIAVLPGYCIPEYAPLIGLTTVPIRESQQLIYGVVSHKGRLRESWRYFLHLAEEKLLRDPTSTRLDPAGTPPAP